MINHIQEKLNKILNKNIVNLDINSIKNKLILEDIDNNYDDNIIDIKK